MQRKGVYTSSRRRFMTAYHASAQIRHAVKVLHSSPAQTHYTCFYLPKRCWNTVDRRTPAVPDALALLVWRQEGHPTCKKSCSNNIILKRSLLETHTGGSRLPNWGVRVGAALPFPFPLPSLSLSLPFLFPSLPLSSP